MIPRYAAMIDTVLIRGIIFVAAGLLYLWSRHFLFERKQRGNIFSLDGEKPNVFFTEEECKRRKTLLKHARKWRGMLFWK